MCVVVHEREAEKRVLVGVRALGKVAKRGRNLAGFDVQVGLLRCKEAVANVGAQEGSQRGAARRIDRQLVEQGQAVRYDDVAEQVHAQMAEWTVTAPHAVGIQRFGVGNRQQQVEGAADENGRFIRGLGRRGRSVAQQRANKQQTYRRFSVIRSHRSFHQHGGKPAQQNYSG